jgi:hypothetical protein
MSVIQEIIKDLTARKRSVSCNGKAGLLFYMQELGFKWKKGTTDGHKVFVHSELNRESKGQFTTHSIDCGHAPKHPMKFPYVVKTINLLKKYEVELTLLLKDKGQKND